MAETAKNTGFFDRLYIGKSTFFKIFLLIGVAVISSVFIWYTFQVIDQLNKNTRSQVDKYVKMWQLVANSPTSGQELQFIFDEIIVKADFPIIVLNENETPIHWRNIENISPTDYSDTTKAKLVKEARDMIDQHGKIPLEFGGGRVNYFCYGDSKVIKQLTMMPFIEIGIVLAFMMVAIIGFQNIKRSEERNIWVGMAKETAHQLGTPISSLMGWIEVMTGETELSELNDEEKERLKEALSNMWIDVNRLNKIANRFGQIGSIPTLQECDLNQLLRDTVEYYRRRLPFEGKGINLELITGEVPLLKLNNELFSWAVENLIKNALQVVDSRTGRIEIKTELHSSQKCVIVEITDNGPGISKVAARKIFRAGFTTKKRGWGLGLTLVRRIVEEYHSGRVILKKSGPGQTVFVIQLPVIGNEKDNNDCSN